MTDRSQTEPNPTPVRRRSVLGVSGWLLFGCLFLPTLRVCGDPVAPIAFPPTYGIYLSGIAVAIIGFSTLRRRRQITLVVIQGIYLASMFAFAALWIGAVLAEAAGVIAGVVFIFLLIAAIRRAAAFPWSERAIAIGCLTHALVSLGWSALLAFDPDGMWGAHVSLGAASLMLFASSGYLARELEEARNRRVGPVPLPEARVV